jgi:glycosyltransferase involved in cell wall biosynthesis
MNGRFEAPLVSVVIPCYNHKRFLQKCLDSVAAQTYKNIEVVIVDDCSADGSPAEIQRLIKNISWESRFPRQTQFHSFAKNQGAHAAINYGIAKANGDIIALLNSDDMYHPERIQCIVGAMQNQKSEFVFSGVEYVDESDRVVTNSHPVADRYFCTQKLISQYPSVGFACLICNVSISTGNFAFTKALFNRVGEFSNYRYCHDWDFLLRSLLHTEPFFLDRDLYYYRFHGKNTFETLESIAEEESTKILTSILSKMQVEHLPNPVAPSPLNWPSYFELFLYWFNLARYLKAPA